MLNPDKGFFTPNYANLQPVAEYGEVEKSPPLVAKQTHALLGLYYHGAILNPQPARDYLHDYTLGYLNAAEEGSVGLYDRVGQLIACGIGLEIREAASHAFVVMASLPDRAKSPYFPEGFSRIGMLSAPKTQDQFLRRIKELKVGIWEIVEGSVEPHATLEAYPSALRVFKFFEVGSDLPVKLTADERKQEQLVRERFNDLLDGIDTSL